MPIRSNRGLRRLQKVLEDWISEDWGDSSDSDIDYNSKSVKNNMTKGMEGRKSDTASSSNSEIPCTSSEDERLSSRMSNASSIDHLPPPPKYESVLQHPVKDYTSNNKERVWDREVDRMVGDFDRKCATSMRDQRFSTLPNQKLVSSGTHSYAHEETATSSRGSLSPPRSNSALGMDRDFDWDRSLLSNDDFFRDSRLRQRRPFGRPFGGMRSAFGDEIDSFFGRNTSGFGSDWDTFFPEISFSGFSRGSGLSSRGHTQSRDLQPVKHDDDDFKVEVDVKGFEPNELLVKTIGQSLLVLAKTETKNGAGQIADRNHEFRELRREFTIPSNVNPTDISSNLTPDGVLVIEAPSRDKLSIQSNENKKEIENGE